MGEWLSEKWIKSNHSQKMVMAESGDGIYTESIRRCFDDEEEAGNRKNSLSHHVGLLWAGFASGADGRDVEPRHG